MRLKGEEREREREEEKSNRGVAGLTRGKEERA